MKYELPGGKNDLAVRKSHALFDQRVESFMTYWFQKEKHTGKVKVANVPKC